MSKKPQTKYRPSITARQIRKIIDLARNETPISDESIQLISVLSPFLAKIESGANKPAYVTNTKPPANSLEALGAGDINSYSKEDTATRIVRDLSLDPNASKEELWEACYNKYKADPTSCSANEILCANEHRYLNDMMSPEEIAAFEKQQFTDYNQ